MLFSRPEPFFYSAHLPFLDFVGSTLRFPLWEIILFLFDSGRQILEIVLFLQEIFWDNCVKSSLMAFFTMECNLQIRHGTKVAGSKQVFGLSSPWNFGRTWIASSEWIKFLAVRRTPGGGKEWISEINRNSRGRSSTEVVWLHGYSSTNKTQNGLGKQQKAAGLVSSPFGWPTFDKFWWMTIRFIVQYAGCQ